MAKKVTVTLVDDFDGEGAADETVEFGLDGVTYEIDLSNKNAGKLRADLKQWIESARARRDIEAEKTKRAEVQTRPAFKSAPAQRLHQGNPLARLSQYQLGAVRGRPRGRAANIQQHRARLYRLRQHPVRGICRKLCVQRDERVAAKAFCPWV